MMPRLRPALLSAALLPLAACEGWRDALSAAPYQNAGPGAVRGLDTGPADTGPADTGPEDTGPADTGPADTGPADTGPAPG